MDVRHVWKRIGAQFTSDLRAARKLWMPWRVLLPFGAFSFAVIIVCDHFGRENIATPMLGSILVFGGLIYLKWDLRRQPLFWSAVAILAALHALVISYVPWTSNWVPASRIAAIFSINLCLLLLISAAIETLVRDRGPADE